MKIYCVTGLGNDKRIFDNLIPLLDHKDIYVLEHLEPIDNESICDYAKRLILNVNFEENSIIIGMSLGGMISVELSKLIKFRKVFLISTVKHPNEFPWQIQILKRLPIDKIKIPSWFIKKGVKTIMWLYNTTNYLGREHISNQVNDALDRHIEWAQLAATKWDNRLIPDNYVHIHGTKDEIFPSRNVRASHFIQNANHYMIMDRANDVAHIINYELSKLDPI